MTTFRRSLFVQAAAAGLALALSAAPARAQALSGVPAWSTAGSTGIVDDANTSIVAFGNTGGVSLKPTAPAGSIAVVRYPVSFLPTHLYNDIGSVGYFAFDHLRLSMTFRKPDENSYASATLKRVRLSDGVVSSVASVNTFGSLPGASVQQSERTIGCGDEVACVNSYEYAYFIELVLWKPESTNDPQVVGLRVYTAIS
jgi:hypothetical protein